MWRYKSLCRTMKKYIAKKREGLSPIAHPHRFRRNEIGSLRENEVLRKRYRAPDVLFETDEIWLPEHSTRKAKGLTQQHHHTKLLAPDR